MSFLWLRGSTWFFRRAIPLRLRPILNQREVRISLKTGDPQLAKRRAIAEAAKVDRMFAEAEAAHSNPHVGAYRALQEDAKERAERGRRGFPRTEEEDEAFDSYLTTKLEENGLSLTQRAIFAALLKRNENGNAAASPPLSVVWERWAAERRPPAKTLAEFKMILKRLQRSLGGDLPVSTVTKDDIRRFKEHLLSSTSERIKGRPTSPATARKILGAVRAVLQWAYREGLIPANPADGVSQVLAKSDPADRRLPFTPEHLGAIFSAVEQMPDKNSADYWLPWLGLTTGMREDESGALLVSDVRSEDGVWFIAVEPREGRSLKTRSSVRRVPLHPLLVERGFFTFVERQKKAGHSRLFPELKAGKYGSVTAQYSKRFGRLLRSVGIEDRRLVYHSFRHTMKDRMRAARVPDTEQRAILGHAGQGVADSYGTGFPIAVLAESMAQVTFPGLIR